MKYTTEAEIVAVLTAWRKYHDQIEKIDAALRPLFGDAFEGDVVGTLWEVFGAYTAQLAENIGDSRTPAEPSWASMYWIQWYCNECDMGRKPMHCTIDGKTIKATSDLRTIAQIVMAWRARKQ